MANQNFAKTAGFCSAGHKYTVQLEPVEKSATFKISSRQISYVDPVNSSVTFSTPYRHQLESFKLCKKYNLNYKKR